MAFGDTPGSDYLVGQAWAQVGPDRYLVRQIREQLSFVQTLAAVREMTTWIELHLPGRAHAILVEKAANGAAVLDVLQRQIPGVIAVEPRGDKLTRAHAISPQVEAGNVYLPGAPIREEEALIAAGPRAGYRTSSTRRDVPAFHPRRPGRRHRPSADQAERETPAHLGSRPHNTVPALVLGHRGGR